MQYLILGTGRCGTGYLAQVLQASGIQVGHEKRLRDGISAWQWAVPFVRKGPPFDKVLHVVRHPLPTVQSFETAGPGSWRWISQNTPVREQQDLRDRCLLHWWYWNLICEHQADLTVKIEDPGGPKLLEEFFGQPLDFDAVPKNYNTRRKKKQYRPIDWKSTKKKYPWVSGCIEKMATRYGYSL